MTDLSNEKPWMNRFTRTLLALLCTLGLTLAVLAADDTTELLARGTALLEQGQLESAGSAFEAALRTNPNSLEACMKLAGINLAMNRSASAITLYQRAIGLNPDNAKAFIGLGLAYLHGHNKELSLAALREAVRIEPSREAQLAPLIARLEQPD